ncbi:hydroxyacid dehydrogenase [Paenibacillus lutimineralis]|uniref:Hydroxyacid dehydrogenase n=1 Tax=Paenibacillus lutimineralis TaxID=2707005 RepID=A0A3Q9IAI8_9BACL|nr:hydroxyacid dehydrogenase [Paenibacillus lutimineralis]AZS13861.1 hydroxyacid dehydrogenase [Paenibacillus lutimineralis]
MEALKILVTMPKGEIFDTFFNEELESKLEEIGEVIWNDSIAQYTKSQLCEKIKDIDICVTGWGTEAFDEEVLNHANKLRLIAHTGGSVRPYVTDAAYDRGIRVVSGNEVFAQSVAESVIAYALASLRDIPRYSAELKQGIWPWNFYNQGLLDKTVGIVGYGMIAKMVVEMLKPFHVKIKVFSRHISQEELEKHNMEKAELSEIFSTCDIVSLHSGMTKENHHMITEDLLNMMPKGALLINTARGAIIDEEALCRVLSKGEIRAVLDVYEVEPLPAGHKLMEMNNAILMPHMGGPTIDRRMIVTRTVIGDIKLFLQNKPMTCEIDRAYAAKMSTH